MAPSPHLPLQLAPTRMEVELMVDGDLDAGCPRKCPNRAEILALDGEGFFDKQTRDAGRFGGFENLQAHRGRRIHVDQVRPLPLEHFAVVRVPRGNFKGGSKRVEPVPLATRHGGQPALIYVPISFGQPPRPSAPDPDNRTLCHDAPFSCATARRRDSPPLRQVCLSCLQSWTATSSRPASVRHQPQGSITTLAHAPVTCVSHARCISSMRNRCVTKRSNLALLRTMMSMRRCASFML